MPKFESLRPVAVNGYTLGLQVREACKPSVYPFTPTGLKLSNLGIFYNLFSRFSCSSRLPFSSQVYVEHVDLLVKLCQAYLMPNVN